MNKKENRGITLVALVITIIVLLILAGVSINAIQNGGIIKNATDAKNAYDEGRIEEEAELSNLLDKLAENGGIPKRVDGESTTKGGPWIFDSTTGTISGYDINIVSAPTELVIPNYIDGYEVKVVSVSGTGDNVLPNANSYVFSEGIEEISGYCLSSKGDIEIKFPKTLKRFTADLSFTYVNKLIFSEGTEVVSFASVDTPTIYNIYLPKTVKEASFGSGLGRATYKIYVAKGSAFTESHAWLKNGATDSVQVILNSDGI